MIAYTGSLPLSLTKCLTRDRLTCVGHLPGNVGCSFVQISWHAFVAIHTNSTPPFQNII